MLNYNGADGIKTGYIKASGFQLAFSAVRDNKRIIGVYFGGDTSKQRNDRLELYMNSAFKKLIEKPIITKKLNTTDTKKQITVDKNKYSIVVGTFKYEKC